VVFSKTAQNCLPRSDRTPTWTTPIRTLRSSTANVLEFTPEGKLVKIYASGLRNCVGEAINPITGELWCSTNERDGLGNNSPTTSHVQEDGFYGCLVLLPRPSGGVQDPRTRQASGAASQSHHSRILVNPHFASLEMLFYEGRQFPPSTRARDSPRSTAHGRERARL